MGWFIGATLWGLLGLATGNLILSLAALVWTGFGVIDTYGTDEEDDD